MIQELNKTIQKMSYKIGRLLRKTIFYTSQIKMLSTNRRQKA